jgi:hypothetical protein
MRLPQVSISRAADGEFNKLPYYNEC